jgi:cytochrome c oxidase subunit 3
MHVTPSANLYGFTFYMLTGLHAAHVIGGLALLAIVTVRAFCGRYSANAHAGVLYSTMYWHFLDGVWLVMFAVMLLGS